MAVERSLGWVSVKKSDQMTGKTKTIEKTRFEVSGVIEAALYNYSL